MRTEFLHSRNARGVGMLAQTDLVEGVDFEFNETDKGRRAKGKSYV